MNEHTIQHIVIVGGGTAGWMAAAAMSRFMNNGVTRITLVESDEIGTIGVGEATIPPIITFNRMLGINENEFLRATQGTYKLGIEFVNWGGVGERYFHPFGSHGEDLHGIHFHQLYLRERKRRVMQDISSWSMSGVAASLGRFARPTGEARSPIKDLFYAFHFDAALYAKFLRNYAERGGVRRIEGKIVATQLRGEDGFVESVTLADGQVIAGDLFIDCSGFRGLLIEEALNTGYEDWTQWLPANRAIAVPTALTGEPDPYTRATAHEAGWQWRIPLQHRMGNGIVYSSQYLDDDAAERTLLANLDGKTLADPRRIRFTTGRRTLSWNKNVVAMGLAGGFVEPLESTSIHVIQAAIAKLIALFPDKRFNPVERDEFNDQMRDLYEDIRDFIVLHYNATRRTDSPFWNHMRTMEIPATLRRKIDLFRAKGRLFREGRELFATTSYVAVMLGQHIVPEEHEPAVDALDEDKVAQALEEMRLGYLGVAQQLPSHAEFIAATGAAPPPQAAQPPTFSFADENPGFMPFTGAGT
ncbi:tryptophan halogenase family protein [Sphingomonas crusticola]|uniref:tryptophan halogenase family protein n=1 Tax=Sphingomonas crusticola TaxID=1697973 RepID=UPI000E2481A7|nr:tryptophan halogenase family protein [Sphingomonas crusticola]